MEELKMYLLYKLKELKENPHRDFVKEYTEGCIDMITDTMNKIDEIEHPDMYE